MYTIKECDIRELKVHENDRMTICQTYEWIKFLENNQKASPVLLRIMKNDVLVAFFIGLIITKYGVKILGSPFEGWLTPDMGFIEFGEINYSEALKEVARYAFKNLSCYFVQIIDKKISREMLSDDIITENSKTLYIRTSNNIEKVLENFTKNGRRDVRASGRKGVEIKKVLFSENFNKIYYNQLLDVFSKQNLKPFYNIKKLNDLSLAFKENKERILALEAYYEGKCIATVFTAGFGNWAYYIGAASYREYQKYLPNEALFWEFVQYWHSKGIRNFDLVGYREYKMKYNPELICYPVIIFSKYKVLLIMKKIAKKIVRLTRIMRGK